MRNVRNEHYACARLYNYIICWLYDSLLKYVLEDLPLRKENSEETNTTTGSDKE